MSKTGFLIKINNPQITQLGLAADMDYYQSMSVAQFVSKGIVACITGVSDANLNVVIDTQITEDSILEKIDEVVAFFQPYKVNWRWVIGPHSKPFALSYYLKQKGFTLLRNSPNMYLDLTQTNLPIIPLKNWEIREMQADDDLTDWFSPIQSVFSKRNRFKTFQTIIAHLPHGPGTTFRHYVGYYRQQPVSSITLFISKRTIAVHNLATLPVFSRRGLGKKLMVYALSEAKKMGFKHCFLESSEKGYRLYRRIGFQVYSVYQNYGVGSVN